MYKVVIVDDQQEFLDQMQQVVVQFFKDSGTAVEVICYNKPELMRYDILEGKGYDIYILDVEMPGLNGLQLGEEIRSRDENAVMIFVTSHAKYSLKAFEVQAQHYILKSQIEQKLQEVLGKAYKAIRDGEKFYVISTNSRYEKIYHRDIYCFYKDGKNTVFIKSDGDTFVRKTVQSVFKELNAPEFIHVDRGLVVNIAHVMKIHSHDLYLSNGQRVTISKSNMNKVKTMVHEYWKGQLS